MKLNDYLYYVSASHFENGRGSGVISLNPECAVYSGHFAGMPVTPGACLTKIAEELISGSCRELRLCSIKEMKFLSIIIPDQSKEIKYEFSLSDPCSGLIRVDFNFCMGEVLCARMTFMYE